MKAYIGAFHEPVRDEKWVNGFLAEWRRKHIKTFSELYDTAGFPPPRELSLDFPWIGLAREQIAGRENILFIDDFQ